MNFIPNRTVLACATCMGLAACEAPTLVSLQPIGAPMPTNAQQTFVDADRCSWWIVGNGSDLRWAPMTNSVGEHVCDGGATRFDRPAETNVAAAPDTFADEMRAALDAPEPTVVTDAPTVITPETNTSTAVVAPAASTPSTDNRAHYVQVATFARENNAAASEKLFKSLGYNVDQGALVRDEDRLIRLVIGPFSTRDEAQTAVERAFNEGFDDAFPFRK